MKTLPTLEQLGVAGLVGAVTAGVTFFPLIAQVQEWMPVVSVTGTAFVAAFGTSLGILGPKGGD